MKTAANSETACKEMWNAIRVKWGAGWKHLGDDLKRAIIAEQVLHSFAGMNDGTAINSESLTRRLEAMLDYCGLGKGE